ncbi:MAG: hypothetical protein WBQ10_15360 [Terriglobales bacterium]
MDIDHVLACGIVWRKTADPEAGWELIEGLESKDPQLRLLAQTLLVESGDISIGLLENALAAGVVNPDIAVKCMADILRIRRAKKATVQPVNDNCNDASPRWEVAHLD